LNAPSPEGLQARQLTSVNQKTVPTNTRVAAELLTRLLVRGHIALIFGMLHRKDFP